MNFNRSCMTNNSLLAALAMAILIAAPLACRRDTPPPPTTPDKSATPSSTDVTACDNLPPAPTKKFDFARQTREKVIIAIVPLCDNANQGIVKVPASLGNGQNPSGNLYWGAMYGLKTFFTKSPHWKPATLPAPINDDSILEWATFKHSTAQYRLTLYAAAVDGAKMKRALELFFLAAAEGDADLVCFVGHNGLMDIRLDSISMPKATNSSGRSIVLACKSDEYFALPLMKLGCRPLITTSQYMAPEAYTLEAILRRWGQVGDGESAADAAAAAYSSYQKCSQAAARRIFVAGQR